GIAAGGTGGLASGVYHGNLIAHDERDLQHDQRRHQDQRHQHRELHRRLPGLALQGSTFPTTSSKSLPMAWLFVAHAMSRAPIAAAPRMTSAYSAVVCPTSARTARTNRRSIGSSSGSGSTGEALDARQPRQQ